MTSSIFEVDAFDECTGVEPLSLVELAAQQCVLSLRGARKPRRDDIVRAFTKVQPSHRLSFHDFGAFRLAWIAEYRALGGECAEPEMFFNKQLTCGCRECAAKHAA